MNFLSGDIFIDNNYLYRKRLSERFDDVDNTDGSNDSQIGNYSDVSTMDAYSSIRLRGPSYIRNSSKFSWGIHTALRSATSITNAPTHLVKFIKEGYVIVATDYQGLGGGGKHQYSVAGTNGRDLINSARAAISMRDTGASKRTIFYGWSQGGGATIAAASLGAYLNQKGSVADDLQVLGFVAIDAFVRN